MRLGVPVVIVNYKVYPNAIGRKALDLTRRLEKAAAGRVARLAVCPSLPELAAVADGAGCAVLAQHVSGRKPGSGTGDVVVAAIADWGVAGSLVNHAERQVPDADVSGAVTRLRGAGLASVVCTADEAATRRLGALRPDFVAMEPPALIGGDVSVTTADPDIVRRSVAAARSVSASHVLCGAGVKNGADVAAALRLGAEGVLVASGVVLAKDPAAALADLLDGLEAK